MNAADEESFLLANDDDVQDHSIPANLFPEFPAPAINTAKDKTIDKIGSPEKVDALSNQLSQSSDAGNTFIVSNRVENQAGKRKFVSEALAPSDTSPSSLKLPRKEAEGPAPEEEEEEAGLSLLFAASLIQQTNDDNLFAERSTGDAIDSILPSSTANGGTSKTGDAAGTDMINPLDHVEPTDNDVLCGRGGYINKHIGNIIYRRVVEYNKQVYKRVPKRHRMLVSISIVHAVFNAGGQFLQQDKDKWTKIAYRRAVQKTSQALRERGDDSMATTSDTPLESLESNSTTTSTMQLKDPPEHQLPIDG